MYTVGELDEREAMSWHALLIDVNRENANLKSVPLPSGINITNYIIPLFKSFIYNKYSHNLFRKIYRIRPLAAGYLSLFDF